MVHLRQESSRLRAFTLIETMVALAAGVAVGAVFVSASISVQKSIAATKQYVTAVNNENRIVDYVAQDLRRALRVGKIVSGAYSKVDNVLDFGVSEINTLAINVPDIYGSNTPNNSRGSAFKTSRYNRNTLNTAPAYNSNANTLLNGCVPWAEAVTTVRSKVTPRFAPPSAGSGEIQVRYFRGPRSATDGTVCYFRGEYPSNSNIPNSPPREIAERIVDQRSSTALIINGYSKGSTPGMIYRIQSKFTPGYRLSNTSTQGTEQYVYVALRTARRD